MKNRLPVKTILIVIFAAFFLILPHLLPENYYVHMLVMANIYCILALSLGFIIGFTGQVSLCHAAFYGIGAYASALMALNYDLSFWITMWGGMLVSGGAALLIGVIVLRLKGHFLAITSGFFGIFITLVINNWTNLTKGPMGLPGIPRPKLFSILEMGIDFSSRTDYYYLSLLLVLFTGLVLYRLIHSRVGNSMIAIRENEELAQSLAINVMYYKTLAFSIGGAFAGLAGSLYAHYILFISPVSFTMAESMNILVMVIFGGMQTFWGPIVGAVILTILPEFLRMAGELRLVLYGLALMLIIIYMPHGLVGYLQDYLRKQRWFTNAS